MFLALSFNVVISPLTRVKWGCGGAKDRIDRILPSTCQNVKKKKHAYTYTYTPTQVKALLKFKTMTSYRKENIELNYLN